MLLVLLLKTLPGCWNRFGTTPLSSMTDLPIKIRSEILNESLTFIDPSSLLEIKMENVFLRRSVGIRNKDFQMAV